MSLTYPREDHSEQLVALSDEARFSCITSEKEKDTERVSEKATVSAGESE